MIKPYQYTVIRALLFCSILLLTACRSHREIDVVKVTSYQSEAADNISEITITKYTDPIIENHRKSIYYSDKEVISFSYDFYGLSEHLFTNFQTNTEQYPRERTYSVSHYYADSLWRYYISFQDDDLNEDNSYVEISFNSDTLEYSRTLRITPEIKAYYIDWIDNFTDSVDLFLTPPLPDLSSCNVLISSSYKRTKFLNAERTHYREIYADTTGDEIKVIWKSISDVETSTHVSGDSIYRAYHIRDRSENKPDNIIHLDTLFVANTPVRIRNNRLNPETSDTIKTYTYELAHRKNQSIRHYYLKNNLPDTTGNYSFYRSPFVTQDIYVTWDKKGRLKSAHSTGITYDGVQLEAHITWDKNGTADATYLNDYKGHRIEMFYPYAYLYGNPARKHRRRKLLGQKAVIRLKTIQRDRYYTKSVDESSYHRTEYEIFYKH